MDHYFVGLQDSLMVKLQIALFWLLCIAPPLYTPGTFTDFRLKLMIDMGSRWQRPQKVAQQA
jgi:hypothetical protein